MKDVSPIEQAERFLRELDWNLLRSFIVLAESSSITEAAGRLRLKQPSVSSALKRLEDRLGKRLIDRSPGHYRLTEAGKALYREAVEIQGNVLRLSTLMREVTDEVTGNVRIAVASHVVCPVFDDLLGWFHETYPRASLSIEVRTSSDAAAAALAQQATFAICLVNDRNPRLEYRRLYREFFGLYCGPRHPLFGRDGLTLSDLAGHSSVSFGTDRLGDVLKPVTLIRAAADMHERTVGVSNNLEEVRRMIIAGLGIGPLPLHVAREDEERGLLWRVPPYENEPAIDVYVVWNPVAKLNRAEEAMREEILSRIEAIPVEQRTYR